MIISYLRFELMKFFGLSYKPLKGYIHGGVQGARLRLLTYSGAKKILPVHNALRLMPGDDSIVEV